MFVESGFGFWITNVLEGKKIEEKIKEEDSYFSCPVQQSEDVSIYFL